MAAVDTRVREPDAGRFYVGPKSAERASPAPIPPEAAPAGPAAVVVKDHDCPEARATLTLELRVFLKLLIQKGVLKPGEYTDALRQVESAAKPQ